MEGELDYLWAMQLAQESFVWPVVEKVTGGHGQSVFCQSEYANTANRALSAMKKLQAFYDQSNAPFDGEAEILLMGLLSMVFGWLAGRVDTQLAITLSSCYVRSLFHASGEVDRILLFGFMSRSEDVDEQQEPPLQTAQVENQYGGDEDNCAWNDSILSLHPPFLQNNA